MPSAVVRLAIIDNSIDSGVYKPVEHWAGFLPISGRAFRAPDGRLPDGPSEYSHYILTGSEASILDRPPWVEAEAGFVREAFAAGASILGSCYGHQLLAYALFGSGCVGRGPRPEVGWLPIEILASNGLLGPAGTAYAFSHHRDEVLDLPSACSILARSEGCEVQAFGVPGRNVWGIQMHPEIDIPTGRAFLADLAARGAESRELDLAALDRPARDSGLISKIVNHFIAFSS
ncbi:MAG: type 1 glutamine amidotransferase [Acidobacteriota bacterium]|nr:type 1 glutamine amidotransferase [Acidobacteriota bacterium]